MGKRVLGQRNAIKMDARITCARCGRRGYSPLCRDCRDVDPEFWPDAPNATEHKELLKARNAAESAFYTWVNDYYRTKMGSRRGAA